LGAGPGDRLHKRQEQGEQALRELGRGRRFFCVIIAYPDSSVRGGIL
jgi:hypothetical protein